MDSRLYSWCCWFKLMQINNNLIYFFSQELENLKTYPVEVIAGLLYVGDQTQGMDSRILKDLKISAVVSISQSDTLE